MSFKQKLIEMDVCKEAIEWVGDRTLNQAWLECPYGDWMLWLLEKMEGKEGWLDEKKITLLGCWCARRALEYYPEGETKPLKAIETKEKWAKNEITREEMNATIAVARDATIVAAKDATWGATSVARGATSVAKAVACVVAMGDTKAGLWNTIWIAKRDKELLAQADYIRTQFTPPV